MFNNDMKETIIVVTPEDYKPLARKLVHGISKHSEHDGTVWDIKQYEDSETTNSSFQYVIFLGNVNENKFTKDYLDIFDNIENKDGACYGYDGKKAIIFGEGDLSKKESFEKAQKERMKIIETSEMKEEMSVGETIAYSILGLSILPFALLIMAYDKYEEKM